MDATQLTQLSQQTGIRPELLAFAQRMEQELQANGYKGTWKQADPKAVLEGVFDHFCKFENAVRENNVAGIAEYSADVGNMAMMVADLFGVFEAVQ